MEREIKFYESKYAREGRIWMRKGNCTICADFKVVLCSDGSQEEYTYASLCFDCVKSEFDKGI